MNLLGKEVKVVMRDGFIKSGYLREVTANYIVLEFFSGKQEIIAFGVLKSVSENNR